MKKTRIFKSICLLLVLLFSVGYVGASLWMAKSIARSEGLSLAEEEKWEREHQLWGDYDTFDKTHYTVKGFEDYTLHCTLVKAKEEQSKGYVILTHGFDANRYGSVKYIEVYRDLGYHCLIYDVRGHGENEESICTLGNLEAKDLKALIEDTYARYGEDITLGLHGESMGSAISLSVLAYQPKIEFVIADCGFSNLYDLMQTSFQNNHVGFMIHGVDAAMKYCYGVDMRETNPMKALKKNTVPICFIHGEADKFILPSHSKQLSVGNPSEDRLHIVPEAEHASSREVLGKEGYAALLTPIVPVAAKAS